MHRDRRLAWLAARQDGVASRCQLDELGFTRRRIARLLAGGSLVALHRGVYAVGHSTVSQRGRMRAALLAAGPDAVLSHVAAAAAWQFVAVSPEPIDVTVVGRKPRSRAGVRVHVVGTLHEADRSMQQGLAITRPARTLLDLAAVAPADDLARAVREARVRRLVDDRELAAAIARAPSQHCGRTRLRAALGSDGAAPTRSALERAFLRLVADAGLPRPEADVSHDGTVIDFLWREHGVLVEVDGWAAHGTRAAFEADRARDADRQAEGLAVLRFTWRQVNDSGLRVVARVAQTLGTRSARR